MAYFPRASAKSRKAFWLTTVRFDDHSTAQTEDVAPPGVSGGGALSFGSDQTSTHRIKDLSATEARIDRAGAIQLNATVLVSVGVLEAVGATMVWKEGDVAGLKFFEPIDPDAAQAKTIVPSVRHQQAPPPAALQAVKVAAQA